MPQHMLFPLAAFVALLFTTSAEFVCSNEVDCGLNGKCVNGVCDCVAGWEDPPNLQNGQYGCTVMKFKPVEEGKEGYHNDTSTSWGLSPVYDPSDKRWHLFTAQFSGGCPILSWKTNSYIFHAHGPTPQGPWEGSDISLSIFACNPQVILHPDGTWIMLFIGGWHYPVSMRKNCTNSLVYPPPSPDAGLPPTSDGCGPMPDYNAGCGMRMATSKSPYGPWNVSDIEVSNYNESMPVDCMKTNPAPLLLKNGSLVIAFNGGYCHGGVETIAVMIADNYTSPFRINHTPLKSGSFCEDPCIYETDLGYHVLGHYLESNRNSVYFFSEDLITWYESPTEPYSKNIEYTSGKVLPAHRMERPLVVVNDGVPLFMASAVQVNDTNWGLVRFIADEK